MESLSCPICYHKFNLDKRGPMVLFCGHTVCNCCLKNLNRQCPTCREPFYDKDIKKNFIVFKLMEEIELSMPKLDLENSKHLDKETCSTHAKEIDKFCKTCSRILCADCICPHIQQDIDPTEHLISKQELKNQVQKILQLYRKFEKKKQDLIDKVDDYDCPNFKVKKAQIDLELEKVEQATEKELKEIEKTKENLIQEAQDEANRKIREIEAIRSSSITQAKNEALVRIKEIQAEKLIKTENLYKKLDETRVQKEKARLLLKQQLSKLEELSNFEKGTLEDYVLIYQRDKNETSQIEAFITKEERHEEQEEQKIDSIEIPDEPTFPNWIEPRFLPLIAPDPIEIYSPRYEEQEERKIEIIEFPDDVSPRSHNQTNSSQIEAFITEEERHEKQEEQKIDSTERIEPPLSHDQTHFNILLSKLNDPASTQYPDPFYNQIVYPRSPFEPDHSTNSSQIEAFIMKEERHEEQKKQKIDSTERIEPPLSHDQMHFNILLSKLNQPASTQYHLYK